MDYTATKEKLLSLFDKQKLKKSTSEWGFFNEQDKPVRVVAYATNITPEVILHAQEAGADMLITHHDSWEFVFGLKEECNRLLVEKNITHAFFHAPLDDAGFGTSATLAHKLGILDGKKGMPYAEIYFCGVIGKLATPVDFDTFADIVAGTLQEPVKRFCNTQRPVHKIAVVTGGGNMTGEMKVAVDAGCDTYITGEYVLYSQQYARLSGMNLIVGSHTNTEIYGVESMVHLLIQDTGLQAVRITEPND